MAVLRAILSASPPLSDSRYFIRCQPGTPQGVPACPALRTAPSLYRQSSPCLSAVRFCHCHGSPMWRHYGDPEMAPYWWPLTPGKSSPSLPGSIGRPMTGRNASLPGADPRCPGRRPGCAPLAGHSPDAVYIYSIWLEGSTDGMNSAIWSRKRWRPWVAILILVPMAAWWLGHQSAQYAPDADPAHDWPAVRISPVLHASSGAVANDRQDLLDLRARSRHA